MPESTTTSTSEQVALVEHLTFGVEIETTIPAGLFRIGPHGSGYEIPSLPGWKADRDPSIRTTVRGHEACEFVSPVFKGAEGLRKLLADVAAIRAMGAKVNKSCGLHIHVGFDKHNSQLVEKLATLVSNFEKAIYASTGTKARERGRWCNGLNRYGNAGNAVQASAAAITFATSPRACQRWSSDHSLRRSTGSRSPVTFASVWRWSNGP
jgi:Putative amidoligase enzyme